jgi:predicted ATPase
MYNSEFEAIQRRVLGATREQMPRKMAEAYRLQGKLLLRQATPDMAQAEACFHQALDLARCQQVRSYELRAAISLSRLWQQQDRREDAYQLLAGIYHWFTEEFATTDLLEAKALLQELA